MAGKKEITCRKVNLFTGARELIQRSEKIDSDALDWIENQIQSGSLLLFKVYKSSEFIGIFTACVELEYGKPETLAVHQVVSVNPTKRPFLLDLHDVITGLTKNSGLKYWIAKSDRPGMDRRLESHGFEKIETIYRKAV